MSVTKQVNHIDVELIRTKMLLENGYERKNRRDLLTVPITGSCILYMFGVNVVLGGHAAFALSRVRMGVLFYELKLVDTDKC